MNRYKVELKSNITTNILTIFADSSEDVPEILKTNYHLDESNIKNIKLVAASSKPFKCEGCDD